MAEIVGEPRLPGGIDMVAGLQHRAQLAGSPAVHEPEMPAVRAREELQHGAGLAVRAQLRITPSSVHSMCEGLARRSAAPRTSGVERCKRPHDPSGRTGKRSGRLHVFSRASTRSRQMARHGVTPSSMDERRQHGAGGAPQHAQRRRSRARPPIRTRPVSKPKRGPCASILGTVLQIAETDCEQEARQIAHVAVAAERQRHASPIECAKSPIRHRPHPPGWARAPGRPRLDCSSRRSPTGKE